MKQLQLYRVVSRQALKPDRKLEEERGSEMKGVRLAEGKWLKKAQPANHRGFRVVLSGARIKTRLGKEKKQ